MRYLCNKYAPDSPLYPKDLQERALVDQRLDFDNVLFNIIKEAIVMITSLLLSCLIRFVLKAKPLFGFPPNEENMNTLKHNLEILDKVIGDKKYLVGDHLTIADFSVLATTKALTQLGPNLDVYPNFKRWLTGMMEELPNYTEVCDIDLQEYIVFFNGVKDFYAKQLNVQAGDNDTKAG